MSAPTGEALICRQPGASVVTAFPQVASNGVGSQNLDLIQIVDQGGKVVISVNYQGTVTQNPASPTNGYRLGQYFTRLASSASIAQIFADAFENLLQLDILQVINNGGNISYNLNYQGVAFGS